MQSTRSTTSGRRAQETQGEERLGRPLRERQERLGLRLDEHQLPLADQRLGPARPLGAAGAALPRVRELSPFYKFVSANVQEHTREDASLSRSDQIDFLKFMATHGLSPATVGSIIKQLASERRGDTKWKRPVILDLLQYDLFRWHWKRAKPDFSTLFLNSTAHYQHLYWRNMEPEHFKVKPEPQASRRSTRRRSSTATSRWTSSVAS